MVNSFTTWDITNDEWYVEDMHYFSNVDTCTWAPELVYLPTYLPTYLPATCIESLDLLFGVKKPKSKQA